MSKVKEFAAKLITVFPGHHCIADQKSLKRKRGLSLFSFIITIIASVMFLGSFQGESLHVKAAEPEYAASVTFGETTTNYTELTQALVEANKLSSSNSSQAKVKVLKNVNTKVALTINSKKFITLDLNGFTIDRGRTSATGDGAVIINKGNFILNDTSVEGTGRITGGYNSNNPATGTPGGGIINDTSSTFIMRGGNVSGNKSNYAGGISLRNASFILEGGTITGNEISTNEGSGGGVYVAESSVFEMKGGIISGNKATTGGGGG